MRFNKEYLKNELMPISLEISRRGKFVGIITFLNRAQVLILGEEGIDDIVYKLFPKQY
jgi:hypothetical protein